jgi:hypothetical protein
VRAESNIMPVVHLLVDLAGGLMLLPEGFGAGVGLGNSVRAGGVLVDEAAKRVTGLLTRICLVTPFTNLLCVSFDELLKCGSMLLDDSTDRLFWGSGQVCVLLLGEPLEEFREPSFGGLDECWNALSLNEVAILAGHHALLDVVVPVIKGLTGGSVHFILTAECVDLILVILIEVTEEVRVLREDIFESLSGVLFERLHLLGVLLL